MICVYFNPRSHERSDCACIRFAFFCCISIHAPTRGATFQSVPFIDSKRFQSTLPREERQIHIQFFLSKTPYFNPRSHERSDQDSMQSVRSRHHFNPRSHERSDFCFMRFAISSGISIHAPTRGATVFMMPNMRRSSIFQSTLPREERLNHQVIFRSSTISIHAPTRGATLALFCYIFLCAFQSTLPREERPSACKSSFFLRVFQSTLPREERLLRKSNSHSRYNFNPRSHERSDLLPLSDKFNF